MSTISPVEHAENRLGPDFREADPRAVERRQRGEAMKRVRATDAGRQFANLLDAAQKGESTIVTRHGRPVAALVPFEAYHAVARQEPLLSVAGSGLGLWGKDSRTTIRRLRGEWSR